MTLKIYFTTSQTTSSSILPLLTDICLFFPPPPPSFYNTRKLAKIDFICLIQRQFILLWNTAHYPVQFDQRKFSPLHSQQIWLFATSTEGLTTSLRPMLQFAFKPFTLSQCHSSKLKRKYSHVIQKCFPIHKLYSCMNTYKVLVHILKSQNHLTQYNKQYHVGVLLITFI